MIEEAYARAFQDALEHPENYNDIFDGYENDHNKALALIIWQDDQIKNLQLALKIKDEMILDMTTRHVGEWQITPHAWGTAANIKCSRCGLCITVNDERCDFSRVLPKYCSECGAKMEGENK